MLNGEDHDTYIADANLERRDLAIGQNAMLVAKRFPESKTYPGKRLLAAVELASKSISRARVAASRIYRGAKNGRAE